MPKIKRESRSFIVINEENLITEVQRRPILYDKALKGYRKPVIREGAWQEVSVALSSPVEECKKRWRSLRDAFMKQYKLFQRGDTSVKKKWLFYEQMLFLGPYIDAESKYEMDEDSMIEHITSNDDRKSNQQLLNQIVCINADQGDFQQHHIEIEEYNEEQLEEADDDELEGLKTKKSLDGNVVLFNSADIHQKSLSSNISISHTDPDERFLLSCLPILQRLPNKKNALARLKIQQLLYDIEFNDPSV